MKKALSGLLVIACQCFIVGLFFGTLNNDDVKIDKHVSTIHNENLNKIATSVSVLFNQEEKPLEEEKQLEDATLEELPSIEKVDNEVKEPENDKEVKEEVVSTPLVSVDASKYKSDEAMGFKVTEGNRTYDLSDYEFDVVVAVVSGEFDYTFDDALGVVSVILNRCDNPTWSNWAGSTPYQQVIRAGQFEVYFAGSYLKYMPGGSQYGTEKYNIAKQAVLDGLNGIRNNQYLGFRAWFVTGYSDKYIVYGGNRYGYN